MTEFELVSIAGEQFLIEIKRSTFDGKYDWNKLRVELYEIAYKSILELDPRISRVELLSDMLTSELMAIVISDRMNVVKVEWLGE